MFHSICAQWIVSIVWCRCSCTCQFVEEWNCRHVHKTPCFEWHQPCHAALAMKNSAIWLNLWIFLSISQSLCHSPRIFRFYNDLLYSAAFLLLLSKCRLSDRVDMVTFYKLKAKICTYMLQFQFHLPVSFSLCVLINSKEFPSIARHRKRRRKHAIISNQTKPRATENSKTNSWNPGNDAK